MLIIVFLLIGTIAITHQQECQPESHWSYQYDPMSCVLENLSQGNFTNLHEEVFQNASYIELANATFSQFGSHHFAVLPDFVTRLTFSYGNITEIYFLSDTLIALKIFNVQLERFFVAERENQVLRRLDISSRLLTEIPSSITFLVGLKSLTFSGCNLTTVRLELFKHMTSLADLDLSDNRIASIEVDPQLFLSSVRTLSLEENRLQEIDRFPEVFPELRTLSLYDNNWFCDWVTAVRKQIFRAMIVVYGSECQSSDNGGLCCNKRP
uniref:Putative leucine-rich repeat protein n=1 Tax=Culex tarsalis TaxID=7177 RepID=A0A1Q3FQW6_CULTA